MAQRLGPTPRLPQTTPNTRESLDQLQRASYTNLTEILDRLGVVLPKDGTEPMEAPLPLFVTTTAELPDPTLWEGAIVFDTTTNRLVWSDGTAWRNVALSTEIKTFSLVIQTFTGSGTYTPTTGMTYCEIEVQAPGGGGGGGDGAGVAGEGTAAGSGGGGEYAKGRFTAADIGANKTVTIGAVGAAGNNTGGNGGTGGTTSVGTLITAIGGSGGTGTGSNAVVLSTFAGGAGGTGGTGGHLRIPGGAGHPSEEATDNATFAVLRAGKGGDAFLGRGAPAVLFSNATAVAGVAGSNYGGGGRGGQSANTTGQVGGAGGPGIVIVTEYVFV